ncbi:hypothetical protein Avbf_19005, partial [Armadillidium vulgare]
MVRTENALENLTSPGTLETINATEGDNINIACFALESIILLCLPLIIQKGLVLRMLSPNSHYEHRREDIFPDSMYSVILFNFIVISSIK